MKPSARWFGNCQQGGCLTTGTMENLRRNRPYLHRCMRFAAAAAAAAAAPLPHPGVPLSDSHCTAAIISAFLAPQRTSARTTLSSGPEKLASRLVPTLYTIPEVPEGGGPRAHSPLACGSRNRCVRHDRAGSAALSAGSHHGAGEGGLSLRTQEWHVRVSHRCAPELMHDANRQAEQKDAKITALQLALSALLDRVKLIDGVRDSGPGTTQSPQSAHRPTIHSAGGASTLRPPSATSLAHSFAARTAPSRPKTAPHTAPLLAEPGRQRTPPAHDPDRGGRRGSSADRRSVKGAPPARARSSLSAETAAATRKAPNPKPQSSPIKALRWSRLPGSAK
jgi:hypothetical protein